VQEYESPDEGPHEDEPDEEQPGGLSSEWEVEDHYEDSEDNDSDDQSAW
jgi:hypothetical protein